MPKICPHCILEPSAETLDKLRYSHQVRDWSEVNVTVPGLRCDACGCVATDAEETARAQAKVETGGAIIPGL